MAPPRNLRDLLQRLQSDLVFFAQLPDTVEPLRFLYPDLCLRGDQVSTLRLTVMPS